MHPPSTPPLAIPVSKSRPHPEESRLPRRTPQAVPARRALVVGRRRRGGLQSEEGMMLDRALPKVLAAPLVGQPETRVPCHHLILPLERRTARLSTHLSQVL